MMPIPAEIGSIDDYENQGEPSSPARVGGGTPALRIDGSGNPREALVSNVILGALVIGLFAMEVHEAHQQRHR
jgi:hypothetical protein